MRRVRGEASREAGPRRKIRTTARPRAIRQQCLQKPLGLPTTEIQVLEWRQALPHANASSSECLFAPRSNPLPLTCLQIACSSLCHFLGSLVGRAAGIAQNLHTVTLFQCADCGWKFQPWPMSLAFHFALLAERQFTPGRLSLQHPSKAVDGMAIYATATKSQSQKLTFPPTNSSDTFPYLHRAKNRSTKECGW